MMLRIGWLVLLMCWCSSAALSAANPAEARIQTANVALLFPSQLVRPGSQVEGLVQFYIDPGWHLYWKNPGDTGFAPTFDWQLPAGIQIKEITWPAPRRFECGGTFFYGYDKTPQWIVTLAFDEQLEEGVYPITLSAFWLACNGSCIPSSQQHEFSFTVSSSAPPTPSFPLLAEARKGVPLPMDGGKAWVDHDTLFLQLPMAKENVSRSESIILFPESDGIFAVDQLPRWKYEDGLLELSIHSLPTASDRLAHNKQFRGLVQLVSSQGEAIATYDVSIPYHVSAAPSALLPTSDWQAVGASPLPADGSMHLIILMAFLGGVILNFTPCVLPVVGLKVLNLVSLRTVPRWGALLHGLLFTAGVLTTFWILAGLLYLLEYLGSTVGWGFQLQEPTFVVALTILLFCFALNLFGVFEIGTAVSAWAADIQGEVAATSSRASPSYAVSYASGILATLIATPCTGPLLGSVLGFVSLFRPIDGVILFTAIGFGMAFPFLLITAFPTLIRLFPRPGMWMITVKQFFGFCLLVTIVWLLWVLNAEVPGLSVTTVAAAFVAMAFGLWIFGHWGSPVRARICRFVGRAFALIFLMTGIVILMAAIDHRVISWVQTVLPQPQTIPWEPFSKERLEHEVAKGQTVFVRFSAKWCLTCQTNAIAFISPKVVHAFYANKIVALEADWTNGDPAITAMLRSLGRNGVPVYAIFRSGEAPTLLPEIVTPDILASAVSSGAPLREGAPEESLP